MRRLTLFIVVLTLMMAMIAVPVSAKFQTSYNSSSDSVDVTCPDGTEISNGVQVVVNMRPNFTYTATAIGIDGYDPVIGVGDSEGVALCNDDEPSAGRYAVSLPTTGEVDSSEVNAQMPFYHSNKGLTDISLVIGSPDGSDGEFILVLEGMAVTTNDGKGKGAGDPYRIQVTQNIVDSGVPLEVYMISKTRQLNAFMQLADSSGNVITQKDGTAIECNDAGYECWSGGDSLEGSFVQSPKGQSIVGKATDAKLAFDLSNFAVDSDPENNYLRYLMTSVGQRTFGEYIVVMRIGVKGGGSSTTFNNDNNTDNTDTTDNTTNTDTTDNTDNTDTTDNTTKPPFGDLASGVPAPDKNNKGGGGINVTCPDDTEIKNGVHVSVGMAPKSTYKATVVGVNGFDPAIAMVDKKGVQLCVDDDTVGADYSLSLPTTGSVDASGSNTQMSITNNNDQITYVSLIIGSPDGSSGEFALILEGMSVDKSDGKGDGSGDLISVQLTQNMLDSGVPLNVYMLTKVKKLDPLLQLVHADNTVVELKDGSVMECDNAGEDSCWGSSEDMSDSFVSDGSDEFAGTSTDAELSIPLGSITLDKNPDNNFFNFLMTSVNQRTFGDYMVVIHVGV
ncbi:MAG: hypothetical protein GC179_11795 [Anaerolineaceae bacterium]|nr:hypothetical protein [Anaerolineaceae bacterium]